MTKNEKEKINKEIIEKLNQTDFSNLKSYALTSLIRERIKGPPWTGSLKKFLTFIRNES